MRSIYALNIAELRHGDQEVAEIDGERCLSLEGSDFAAEEGYEEGDSNAEEGHEEVWGEVHEDYNETALCARSQASRSSSSSTSRASVRS